MKRIASGVLALLFALSIAAFAQEDQSSNKPEMKNEQKTEKAERKHAKKEAKAENKEAKASEKGKAMRLTGWVKDENGQTVFVNDKDKQTWNVSNADLLKGHEGHHVRVTAKLDDANHSMNVEKVSMLRQGKQANHEKHKKGQ
ncbi:MAG TPA: hypothetical protein VFU76_12955 [Terriglobales bacterium]|nr:hypothetical protein [Terriglobales bacterium]